MRQGTVATLLQSPLLDGKAGHLSFSIPGVLFLQPQRVRITPGGARLLATQGLRYGIHYMRKIGTFKRIQEALGERSLVDTPSPI